MVVTIQQPGIGDIAYAWVWVAKLTDKTAEHRKIASKKVVFKI